MAGHKDELTMQGRWISRLAAVMTGTWLAFFSISADAGPHILVDMGTGQVLDHEDAFVPWYPASLTKLMTTYVIFRAVAAGEIDLDSPVRVSTRAAEERPSKMGYPPGSVLTYDNAIKILMVKSANDVATAVAESLAGSTSAFAQRMNEEAQRIGMNHTNFANASGWHDDTQVTTAHDMAVLAMTMRNEFPQHDSYFQMEAISSGDEIMPNNNSLMRRFAGTDGMKTGYTCPSGFNLVATAKRNGRRMLSVVIGEHTVEARADKAADLLAHGFVADGSDAPFLRQLRPSGDEGATAVNLRPVICTQDHWETVAKARGPSGKPAFASPHLIEPEGEPAATAVYLGGANGPVPEVPVYADVPIPTPRPDFTPGAEMAGGG